jgi:NAD(P)-dependent dehydrogenase (short-subunit alcohol dehydrogenase family)
VTNIRILDGAHAVVYGAGGSMGGVVARSLARAGANLLLAGRSLPPVQRVANEIVDGGGRAEAAQVDATNGRDVEELLERVTRAGHSVDISFCLIDYQVAQGMPLVEMKVEDFVRPVALAMQSHFLTATAAGRIMMRQRSGVILSLTATPGGIGYPLTAGFAPACAAIESFSRNLAAELGPYGVRVVNIRSGGSPDSRVFRDAIESNPGAMEQVMRDMENDTMLKRLPAMQEIANTAVFLASELARSITGVTVDITAGTTAALNYRAPRIETLNRLIAPSVSNVGCGLSNLLRTLAAEPAATINPCYS